MKTQSENSNFAVLLQNFFYQRLIEQRNSSNDTVVAYRDTFKFLLSYFKEKQNISPDASTWCGKRDRVLLATLYNTGARVSEIIALKKSDVDMNGSMSIRITGKGRKQRVVPIWKSTTKQIKSWLKYLKAESESPLFPNTRGQFMTRSGVESRIHKTVQIATEKDSTLEGQCITPHVFRHYAASRIIPPRMVLTRFFP